MQLNAYDYDFKYTEQYTEHERFINNYLYHDVVMAA